MKVCDDLGRLHHQFRGQTSLVAHAVEEVMLREAGHFDHDIDSLSRAIEGEPAIRLPVYGADAEVEVGGRAAVEFHLAQTELVAQFIGGEIDIGQLDGALQLEGPVIHQEDDGNMGFDDLHGAGLAIAFRLAQEGDHLRLIMNIQCFAPATTQCHPHRFPSCGPVGRWSMT